MFTYLAANKVAGYSGFVMYNCYGAVNFWMIRYGGQVGIRVE